MALTIVDWNVNGFTRRSQPEFLGGLEWDVALLQEVTRESWPQFRELADHGDVVFDYLPPIAGRPPRYGCAILVRGDIGIAGFGVLPDIPSPERAAIGRTMIDDQEILLGSWAAPPGVTWGESGKGRQVARFAAWLQGRDLPTVVGVDRNAPRWERHKLADDEWWNRHETLMYGPDRAHDLRDAYRDYLDRSPEEAAAIRHERPDGPLAVTHLRRGIECRYDAIYASPEFGVLVVDHLWDEARAAGSDHALVRAKLSLTQRKRA